MKPNERNSLGRPRKDGGTILDLLSIDWGQQRKKRLTVIYGG